MKIRYNKEQLEAASHFLNTFHPSCHGSFDEANDAIIEVMEIYADNKEINTVETAGFLVSFSYGEEEIVNVDVMIDPTLLFPGEYKEVEREL
jgi:hypothetical protein